MRKERGFYSDVAGLGRMAALVLKPVLYENPKESPVVLSQTKTKGSVQSSFCHLKYCPLGTAGGPWAVIQAVQLVPDYCST